MTPVVTPVVTPAAIQRRPTRAAAVPVALTVLVGLLATSTGNAWLAAVAVAPIVLGVASVLGAMPAATRLQQAGVGLSGPSRARVGDLVTHRVHLAWPAAADEVVVHLAHAGTAPVAVAVDLPGTGGCHHVQVEHAAVHRAAGRTLELRLVVADALRLFRWSRTVVADHSLVVQPRRARPVPVPPGARGSGDGGRPRPSRSGDLAGVRGWQRGDGARDVHWRATARTGLPVVAVREQPEGRTCAVVLAGPVSPADEDRVALCAATGAAVRGEEPSSVVAVVPRSGSATRVPPGPAAVQLDWWAGADLAGGAPPRPREVLAAVPGRGTVLVVGTAALDEAWWAELRALSAAARTTAVRVP